MKHEPNPDGRRTVPTVSNVLPTGELIELVYDAPTRRTLLATGSPLGYAIEEYVDFGGTRLIPWSADSDLIKHEVLLLPSGLVKFGGIPDLIGEIDAYLYRYVDLSDSFRRIAAYYILLTWVYDAFNELPYLRLRGDFGSGKTRALLVIGSLCYKAFIASGASTVSPIFHILDTFRGTLVLDEADFRFSDEKGGALEDPEQRQRARVPGPPDNDQREGDVRAPRILCLRPEDRRHAAVVRRLCPGKQVHHRRDGRTVTPPGYPAQTCRKRRRRKRLHLRNKLLCFRLTRRPGIMADETLVDRSLSPRMNQILVPLLSLVADPALRARHPARGEGMRRRDRRRARGIRGSAAR